jgi:hypothetical protein
VAVLDLCACPFIILPRTDFRLLIFFSSLRSTSSNIPATLRPKLLRSLMRLQHGPRSVKILFLDSNRSLVQTSHMQFSSSRRGGCTSNQIKGVFSRQTSKLLQSAGHFPALIYPSRYGKKFAQTIGRPCFPSVGLKPCLLPLYYPLSIFRASA